jgi:hypothetical protein
MKRTLLSLTLFLSACAPTSSQEGPPRESATPRVADSGASLYVFECRDDWLDDGGQKIFQVSPYEADERAIGPKPSSRAQWIGNVGLRLLLRAVFRRPSDRARLIGHADFEPVAGVLSETTVFNPMAEAARQVHEPRVGFRVKLRASPAGEYFAIEWEAETLEDGPDVYGENGIPESLPRAIKRISGGACQLPPTASLIMQYRIQEDRVYSLILRLTSVRPR